MLCDVMHTYAVVIYHVENSPLSARSARSRSRSASPTRHDPLFTPYPPYAATPSLDDIHNVQLIPVNDQLPSAMQHISNDFDNVLTERPRTSGVVAGRVQLALERFQQQQQPVAQQQQQQRPQSARHTALSQSRLNARQQYGTTLSDSTPRSLTSSPSPANRRMPPHPPPVAASIATRIAVSASSPYLNAHKPSYALSNSGSSNSLTPNVWSQLTSHVGSAATLPTATTTPASHSHPHAHPHPQQPPPHSYTHSASMSPRYGSYPSDPDFEDFTSVTTSPSPSPSRPTSAHTVRRSRSAASMNASASRLSRGLSVSKKYIMSYQQPITTQRRENHTLWEQTR